jgi:phospholipid N-methyltransferase
MSYTATYSPDDNKLRIYGPRFDEETYARVKAAGFRWAPKQQLWVAPMWTPAREDLAIEIAGELEDEDKSLVERAEERSERFEQYSDNRLADAERARKAVAAIADNIPFGQPILVGHHSEKHARADAKRIENGMRKAVNMWKQSEYWTDRANGCLRAAKYKELPEVRARRIKGLEADLRKVMREKDKSEKEMAAWKVCAGINDPEKQRVVGLNIANCGGYWSMCFPLADYPRDPPASQYEGAMGIWSAIDGNVITAAQAAEIAIRSTERYLPRAQRWIDHYQNRLAYERAMLEEAGASDLLKPKPKKEIPPLLNYRAPGGGIITNNIYDRGRLITYPQVDMTKAEYAKIYADYRGTRFSQDKTHRFRTAMIKHNLVCVFLTDSKVHEIPAAPVAQAPEDFVREFIAPPAPRPAPSDPVEKINMAADMKAMQATLKAGIKIQTVNQLFPTPKELAQEVADLAGIEPGHSVLEPSAGTGMLLGAIGGRMFGHNPESGRMTAVEINLNLVDRLRTEFPLTQVIGGDFLEMNGNLGLFDRIVMNPPFENGADIEHIEHALGMLKPGGRLVAICANGPRQQAKLKPIASEWRALPADIFKECGTGVNTALLVIEK